MKQGANDMIRLTYLSQETSPLSAQSLLQLLQQCHANNPKLGITGVLIYANGTFLQTLEGEEAVVDALSAKIQTDSRHRSFKILARDQVDARAYAGWSMGFERLTKETLASEPALEAFQLSDFNPEFLSDHPGVVENLLQRHRSLHWDPLIREIDARDQFIADLRKALTMARQRNAQAMLLIESVTEAALSGALDQTHIGLCQRMVETLRIQH